MATLVSPKLFFPCSLAARTKAKAGPNLTKAQRFPVMHPHPRDLSPRVELLSSRLSSLGQNPSTDTNAQGPAGAYAETDAP